MIRSLLRYLRGYVRICVSGYSPERFLNLCSYHNIYIWEISVKGNGCRMCMSISDFRKIKPLVRKTHSKIILEERIGLPFFIFHYRKRKLFFIGLFLCIVLLKIYSLFIWDIHFEGNRKWPDGTLAGYLKTEGITPGILKSGIDCPGIVKSIRKEYNDIVWVSVSIEGSRLNIRIKENEDTQSGEKIQVSGEEKPTDLIASKDGVITDLITRSGIPLVHEGDQVRKGDILVLGRIEIHDDSGNITGYQYRKADADVYADTRLEYTDTIELEHQIKVYDKPQRTIPFLRIGSTVISAGKINGENRNCELMGCEHQWKAGENFYLPISSGIWTVKPYHFKAGTYSEDEVRRLLSENYILFEKELKEKGIQIKENNVKISLADGSASAKGILNLNERITEEADTEIITIERKESDESVGTAD